MWERIVDQTMQEGIGLAQGACHNPVANKLHKAQHTEASFVRLCGLAQFATEGLHMLLKMVGISMWECIVDQTMQKGIGLVQGACHHLVANKLHEAQHQKPASSDCVG